MKKKQKLSLGRIKIVSLNVAYKMLGAGKSDTSCGDDYCDPELTKTNTDTRNIEICGSLLCTTSD